MELGFSRFATLCLLLALLVMSLPAPVHATSDGSSSPELFQATSTDTPTSTSTSAVVVPTDTPTPLGSVIRPQIAIQNYRTKPENVQYGEDFRLIVKLRNEGQAQAYNVQATFVSCSFIQIKNGGVFVVG